MLAAARYSLATLARAIPAVAGVSGSLALPFVRMLHGAVPMDGNTAAAYVAYGMSEMHTIFPITPASTMGEAADEWNTQKKKNMFGKVTSVTEMESEMGVAGSVHGASMAGALVSTFTSSQGLLLMIPNLYRLAGGLYPAVIHVAARCIAGHALSIYADHQDVMATRMSGTAMLCSNSVQEAMDLAAVSHMAAIKVSQPFLHFFDGFKTSHEVNTVVPIPYETLYKLFDHEAHAQFRARSMSNDTPNTRGCIMGSDHVFQITEASQPAINQVPSVVEQCMDQVAKATGRQYNLFDYYGAKDADRVVVVLGSGAHPIKEMIDHLSSKGEKVGVVMVRLYRPFAIDRFLKTLPKSVKKIAVLDRTREALATGDPLFLDVKASLPTGCQIQVVGGRYGIAGKEFTPMMAKAVFDNLKSDKPMDRFVVGIEDDVTKRSLPIDKEVIDTTPTGTTQCLFWGLGADGTVGANKQAIKIIGTETDQFYGQGNFVYSAHKSGGITISHLRFGPKPQLSSYNITNADYIAVHAYPYIHKYTSIIDPIKVGGTFVLNSPYTTYEQLDQFLPNFVKRAIAERKVMLYNVNATELADKLGLQGKINMIMQAAFFNLSRVLPEKQAVDLLKNAVKKEYGRKGEAIVKKNWEAIDESVKYLQKIEYPASWATLPDDRQKYLAVPEGSSDFAKSVYYPVQRMQGDDVPVSAFDPRGIVPPGMSANEKRGFATHIAQWQNEEDCSQCNMCSALCPHAVIRPFLFTAQEAKAAGIGADFKRVKAKGGKTKGMDFAIEVSGYDCTGCGVCAQACPDGVIELIPADQVREKAHADFQLAQKLPNHTECFDIETLKGSQFVKPFLEFNGACAGCPETAPLKMLTQLFGEDMYIANQAGCTCVWLSTYPVSVLTTNKDGQGPVYGQGLFEDGAEFGFGMYLATSTRRQNLKNEVQDMLKSGNSKVSPKLKELLSQWVAGFDDRSKSKQLAKEIKAELVNVNETDTSSPLYRLKSETMLLTKKTQWLLGGDGWAYDINFQGIDHVLAQGQKVNILVLDNEVYANTGGQASKATPRSSMAKFTMGGKKTPKKDLGAMMMTYGNIYVASICMDADPQQAVKALKEAEAYPGPSIVINYAPCINHGLSGGLGNAVNECKKAVEEGYVLLYRYNPTNTTEGKNPLTLDSAPKKGLEEMLKNEVRYNGLSQTISAEDAKVAHENLAKDVADRYKRYQKMAAQ